MKLSLQDDGWEIDRIVSVAERLKRADNRSTEEVVARVVDDLVEHGGFRSSSPVVLKLLLCLLPRVAPEHAGEFGKGEGGVVLS